MPHRTFFLSQRSRTLLLTALLALGPGVSPVAAQLDLAAIRARAAANDVDALNTLGTLFSNGQGVAQNDAEALRYYARAAELGHAPANFNLGMMHELGRGTPRDLKGAFGYYLKAAESGFAPAQFNVGNMYANGIGTGQDYFEAAIWFRQAAERNVPEAQYNLGLAYELGRGLSRDETLAQKWYRSASEQGYARARYNLALMIEEGRGSTSDEATAALLYRAAAEQGFGPAQNNYGIMLAEGRGGLVTNLIEAYAWLALAAENGVGPVGRDLVAGHLPPDQLGEARNRMAALKAQLGAKSGVAAAAAAPSPAVEDPASNLASRLQLAEGELLKARNENTRLAAAVQDIQREKGQLEQRLNQLSVAAQAAPAADGKLLEEKNTLQAAKTALTSQLVKTHDQLQQALDTAARLQTENARLSSRPAADPAVADLRGQVARLLRENAALQNEKDSLAVQNRDFGAQLQAAREIPVQPAVASTTPATADEQTARLLADNQRLNDEVKRATIELGALARKLRRAETKTGSGSATPEPAETAGGNLADLQRQLGEAQTANRKLSEENQRLAAKPAVDPAVSQQLAAAEKELGGLRAELQAQSANLAQARRALVEAEQKIAAANTAQAGVQKGNAENTRLTADIAAAQARFDETQALLVAARRETEELRVELQSIQGQSVVEASRLKTQLAEGTRALADLREEKTVLEKQLTEARQGQTQTADAAMKNLVVDLAATQTRLAEVQQIADEARQSKRGQEAANASLLAQIESLQGELTALQNRPAIPANTGPALAKLRADLAATQAATSRAEQEKQRLAGEVAAAQEVAARAERERQRFADEAAGAQAAGAKMKNLEAELTATRTQLAEVQQIADEVGQSKRGQEAANASLLAQIESLQAELTAQPTRPAIPADTGPTLAKLRADLTAAQEVAARTERERQRFADEAAGAQAAGQRLEQTNAQLLAQAGQFTSEVQRLTRENQQLADVATQAKGADQNGKLTAQLDAAARTLETKEQAITQLGADIASLKQDLEVARQSTAAALAAQANAARALPDAGAMKLEMQTMQEQVKTLESQIESDQKNAAQEFARLAGQLQQARESNRALADANRSLLNSKSAESGMVTDETRQLSTRVRELTSATEKLTQERNGLRTQLDDMFAKLAEAERQFTQLKQEGDSARNQAQVARTELTALQTKLADADHTTERQGATVAELTGLNDRLAREKTALQTQLAELQKQSERSQTDVADLRERLAANERLGEIQKANVNDLGTANEQLQAQVQNLTGQVATLKADNTRLGDQGDAVTALRRELGDLTNTNQQLTAELTSLRSDNARLAQSDQARQEAEARAASLGTVTAQLAAAQRDLAALRTENSRLSETMQSLERDRTGRISALQNENAAISARLRQAQGTLDQIASVARLINPGSGSTVAPVRPLGGEPAPAAAAPQTRTHIVVEGDSLSRISLRYYGTANRWQDIYDANRDSLAGANALRPGQALRIP